ncbi:MAG: squalene/phytoene synthase family protein [Rhizobiales bacterium]|nr:squalene/phytoene synthase family protein [Hyphomicrobiales bacterium]MBI3673211.1 squalene/phytoene synthase family protein [Hyphomicrobiales bacterium]
MTEAALYCAGLVRLADRDRYLASLFAPNDRRTALLALYAFHAEIARVRQQVSEPHIGEIRLQWWRDTIEAIYGGENVAHPAAEELARAIAMAQLPKAPLIALIDASAFDLYDDPMPDMAALEGYLGETSSALIQMAALVLAGPAARHCATAAGLAGVASGIANLLRAGRGRTHLPKSMDVAAAIEHGRRRLAEARALPIPHEVLPAFLPAGLADLTFDRAARLGERARRQPIAISPLRRQLRLWWMARRDRF